MCGRFLMDYDFARVLEYFKLPGMEEPEHASGEVFPTDKILAVGSKGVGAFKWGVKYEGMKRDVINARVETLALKRMFSIASEKSRILIPSAGFYEWKALGAKNKQKYLISYNDMTVMAGLLVPVKDQLSAVIITTDSIGKMREIHPRMPLIIPRELTDDFLSGKLSMSHARQYMEEFDEFLQIMEV